MSNIDLKKFREKHNLSQQELASIVKKTIRAVQSWEQGKRNMPQSVLVILENYDIEAQSDTSGRSLERKKQEDEPFENWKIDDKLNEIYKFQMAKLTMQDQDIRFLNKKVDEMKIEISSMQSLMKSMNELLIDALEKSKEKA